MLTDKQIKSLTLLGCYEYKSDNYQIKYYAFSEGIFYLNFKGKASITDIEEGFKLRAKIKKEVGFDKQKYVEIWDYLYLPKATREGRLIISENISKEDNNLLAIIFTNCSIQHQVILRTGFNFFTNSQTLNTIKKNNQDAIDFGTQLINSNAIDRVKLISDEIKNGSLTRSYSVNNFDDLWKISKETIHFFNHDYLIIRNPDWRYTSNDLKCRFSIEVAENDIFIIKLSCEFSKYYINQLFSIKNNIANILGLNKSTLYQIFDLTDLNSKTITKHLNDINNFFTRSSELNNVNILINNRLYSSYLLKLKNKKAINKWMLKDNFEDAFHQALLSKEYFTITDTSELIIPAKPKDKDILLKLLHQKINRLNNQHDFEIEQILKMLSQMAWDKNRQPIQINKITSEKLENVYQSIKLIFEDNQELINSYQENMIKLQEKIESLENQQLLKEPESTAGRYKNIFQNLIDVYFEIASDGTVLEISPSCENIFNVKRENIIGINVNTFVASHETVLKVISRLLSVGNIDNFEIPIHANNNIIVCSVNAQLKLVQGNKHLVVGTLRKANTKNIKSNSLIAEGSINLN